MSKLNETKLNGSVSRRMFVAGAAAVAAVAAAGRPALSADLLAEIKKRGYMRVGAFSIPPESWTG